MSNPVLPEDDLSLVIQQDWDKQCATVTSAMKDHVANFVTPISMSEQKEFGEAWGSGTYISGCDGLTYLLTARHNVTSVPPGGVLAHLPVLSDSLAKVKYVAVKNMATFSMTEIDVAAIAISNHRVCQPPPERVAPANAIAKKYSAVPGECLFWMGFPGYRLERDDPLVPTALRRSYFHHLDLPMMPMLSQEPQLSITHSHFDPNLHIAVHYPLYGKSMIDNSSRTLPMPKGMSGSAIWDTKYVATLSSGAEWKPELAEICGVLWFYVGPPDLEVLFATKIEHIRSSLPGVIA